MYLELRELMMTSECCFWWLFIRNCFVNKLQRGLLRIDGFWKEWLQTACPPYHGAIWTGGTLSTITELFSFAYAVCELGLVGEIFARNCPVSVWKTVTATLTGKKSSPNRSSGADFSTDLVQVIKILFSYAESTAFRQVKVCQKPHLLSNRNLPKIKSPQRTMKSLVHLTPVQIGGNGSIVGHQSSTFRALDWMNWTWCWKYPPVSVL